MHMFKLTVLNFLICVHLLHAMPTLVAQETGSERRPNDELEVYVRVTQGDGGSPRAMQTAIARYEGKAGGKYEGIRVDLVGVVHIGEDEYYSALNRRLGKYDSVLYELVAPDGTRVRPQDLERNRSLLGSMQSGMKDMLNLEYQLEKIDYMAKN